jgi:DNA-binding PucR family transcriptional regulator/predicted hydrocarbon binding protein
MRPTMPMINGMVLETKNKISQMTHNRSILVDTHAFGSFRKDLIHNIGIERSKGFLFRYGWNLGRQDAKDCKEKGQYESIEELIEYGPVIHSMKGYVKSITTRLEVKNENGVETLHMESIWENSFEADEQLDKIGRSSTPACYSLSGYASGYVSEVFGQKVIFKEVCCRASGDNECYSIGKSENLWGNEIKDELYFLHERPIVEELELTYEKLLRERDQLILANKINKILTNEVVNGADLKRIIHEVYHLTAIPTAVHTVNGYHTIAAAGFSTDSEELTPHVISQYLNKEQNNIRPGQLLQTIEYNQNSYMLLIYPITLQNKLNGYCSFVFKNDEDYQANYSQMIIDKVSSICALSLFYEKTKIDSFEQMKSLFFREILKGQISSNEEILAKANLFHLDLSKPYFISVMEYNNESIEYQQEIDFRKELFDLVTEYSTRQKQHYLIHQKEKKIFFLFTLESIDESLPSFFEDLYHEIRMKLPMCNLYMGVSKRTSSINQANHACNNAITALRMAFKGKKIVFFESLGVVGALINEKNEHDVREMAYSLLGEIEVQSQKDIDLIQTLYAFLLNGGNLEKTADDLTLSISGLRYRIHKIEERLHKDLRSPIVSYQLLMSIQALIMLGELDMKANVV